MVALQTAAVMEVQTAEVRMEAEQVVGLVQDLTIQRVAHVGNA